MSILPFGSGDDSVFLETPLTSLASVTSPDVNTISAIGSELDTFAQGSFDSIKGYKTPTVVGAGTRAGGIEYDLTASYPPAFEHCGQISFETEGIYITQFERDADNLSAPFNYGTPTDHGGHDHFSDAHSVRKEFISMHATNGGGLSFALYRDGAAGNTYFSTGKQTGNYFTTYGRSLTLSDGEFCRVTLAWTGTFRELYINGVLAWYGDDCTGTVASGAMRYFHAGCGSGGFAPVVSGQHFRNLTLSTKPVSKAYHPLLDIVGVGDSFFANVAGDIKNIQQTAVDPFHSSAAYAMEKVFAEHGLSAQIDISDAVSGAVIWNRGSNEINDQLAVALAKNPRIVIYRGGTNDAIQYHAGNLTDLTLVNTQLLLDAQAILDTPNVEYMVIGTAPTIGYDVSYFNSGDGKVAVDTINGYINGLQAAMTAIDSAYAGRVLVMDMFTHFGKHDTTNSLGYFAETAAGGDVHPGSYGSWEMGGLYAREIIKILGEQ